jgi:hypothetical protein
MGRNRGAMNRQRSMIEAVLKGRFSALLVSLVLLFLISPLISGEQGLVDRVFGIFVLAVLASCLRAIAHSKRFFIFMVLFTLLNLGIGSFEIFGMEPKAFKTMVLVIRAIYFGVVFLSIMRYVLDESPVNGDKICGAISAYMLMGILWAQLYAIFFHLDKSCFRLPKTMISPGHWEYYFSFTTLTTLGFGDITPVSPAVQSYAIMEAACGQIFLAVIIARLIALHITHERDGKS